MDEVRERIRKLRAMGISRYVLEQLVHEEEKLSRLFITDDLRIFLPDYGNIEIKMTPLPKAVFFLFLNHPEGIFFKDLPDYRGELMQIYKQVKTTMLVPSEAIKSIEAVTNPFQNSINEKCSRIREAFVQHFDERLAKFYYVDGKRTEAKRISLPRELIVWE